jgi:hypothetical protein
MTRTVGLGAEDETKKFLRKQEANHGPEPAGVVKLTLLSAQPDGSDSDLAISRATGNGQYWVVYSHCSLILSVD